MQDHYLVNQKKYLIDKINNNDAEIYCRIIIVNWLNDIVDEMRYNINVLFRGIYYMDYYTNKIQIEFSKYQLLAITALQLAIKYEEDENTISFTYCADLCGKLYTIEEFNIMERELLKVLEFNLSLITIIDFIDLLLLHIIKIDQSNELLQDIIYQLATIIIRYKSITYEYPCVIAGILILYIIKLTNNPIDCSEIISSMKPKINKEKRELLINKIINYHTIFLKEYTSTNLYKKLFRILREF